MNIVRQGTRAGATALVMIGGMLQPLPAQQVQGPRDDARRVPAGTRLYARLEGAIDATNSRVGDRFTARVTNASGAAIRGGRIPVGAIVTGTIAGIQRTHGSLAPAFVRLTIESLSHGGQVQPMRAVVESADLPAPSGEAKASTPRGRSFPGVARGSVLVGVNASGATDGSLISLGTQDASLRLPSGTLLTLRVK
jgi:hypothetical protein